MIVPFTLNHQQVYVDVDQRISLSSVLRGTLSISTLQPCCNSGQCGSCLVIWENKLTNSCLLPMGIIAFTSILTLEGFENTPIFESVTSLFARKNISLCSYCRGPRILSIIDLLQQGSKYNDADIDEVVHLIECSCNSYQILSDAIKTLMLIKENYE